MTIITKKNLIILNSALFLIFALVVFTAVKPFLSPKQVIKISGSKEDAPRIVASEERPERNFYDVIAVPENNIFESKIKAPPPPPVVTPIKPIQWELQGTWKGVDGIWHAAILDRRKRQPRGAMWIWDVKAGEKIDEYDVEILEVREDYVKYLRHLPDGTTEGPKELTYTGIEIFKEGGKEEEE